MDRSIAARWQIVLGVAAFVATVVLLHVAQPGYDPVNQFMSELALGPGGRWMVVAFAGLALAVFGVQYGMAGSPASRRLRVLLVAAAVCFLGAGIVTLGVWSELHIALIAAAFVLVLLTMYLGPRIQPRIGILPGPAVSWSLAAATGLAVAAGHDLIPMGIAQRAAAVFVIAWLLVCCWRFPNSCEPIR